MSLDVRAANGTSRVSRPTTRARQRQRRRPDRGAESMTELAPSQPAPSVSATASDLADRGFSIIPILFRGKRPAVEWKQYQEEPPSPVELESWFGNGQQFNVGIVTGAVSGVVVVDLDSEEAIAWADEHLPPSPMVTRTSKGEHWFYGHPGLEVRNKARVRTADTRLAIDIRGDGGYVIGPGSVHETGVAYEKVGDWPPVEELPIFDPAWLQTEAPKQEHPPRLHIVSTDRDGVIERARAYLLTAGPAIQGEGGDEHTFRMACKLVRGFDLSDIDALSLLREWNTTCVPPWTDRELEAKVKAAQKYGTEPFGGLLDQP